jgi:hypothetical protein
MDFEVGQKRKTIPIFLRAQLTKPLKFVYGHQADHARFLTFTGLTNR